MKIFNEKFCILINVSHSNHAFSEKAPSKIDISIVSYKHFV